MGEASKRIHAVGHGSLSAAGAAGSLVEPIGDRHGVAFVMGGHPNVVTTRVNYTTAQSDTQIVVVGPADKIVVTRCSVLVDNACSVDVGARVGLGSGVTPTGDGVVLSHPGIAPGSGVVEGCGSGLLGVGGMGEDLRITSEVPTGGSIDVVVSYSVVAS